MTEYTPPSAAVVKGFQSMILEAFEKRRKQLGLTQSELATRTGLKRSHIAKLLGGGEITYNPTLETIFKLAHALETNFQLQYKTVEGIENDEMSQMFENIWEIIGRRTPKNRDN